MSAVEKFLRSRIGEFKDHNLVKGKRPIGATISVKFDDGHIHHHVADKYGEELLRDQAALSGINFTPEKKNITQSPVIFKNRQAIGDILMMTCAIRDFKKEFPDWPVMVQSTVMHMWDHNPHLDRTLTPDNTPVVEIGPGWLTNASNRDDRHFANAFRISIEEKLGVTFPQGPIKPDVWMTKEELDRPPIVEPPYWIIVAGEKGDWTAKTYPFKWWLEVVNKLPDIKFVQIGGREHKHPDLEASNVINMIGETQDKHTGFRDLMNLYYYAEGSAGLVSFQMHLAAAFNLPCVVIAGAREPARFTRYPGHNYLATDGCLPCAESTACWHCDLEKTCGSIEEVKGQRVPKCVEIIKPGMVIDSILQYYEGGRLSKIKARKPVPPNPPDKADVKGVHGDNPLPVDKKIAAMIDEKFPDQFGMSWGGTSVTLEDWKFILTVLETYKPKTALEFGAGLSTVLISDHVDSLVTYENVEETMKSVQLLVGDNVEVRLWDTENIPATGEHFDFAFMDGPSGAQNREQSVRLCGELADIVIVHDGGRKHEQMYQDLHLKKTHKFIGKGGHRCHVWQRHTTTITVETTDGVEHVAELEPIMEESDTKSYPRKEVIEETIKILDSHCPYVEGPGVFRMVFNGRGEGGAESSTTNIMNAFVDLGWEVQYVSPNGPSGTFRKHGSNKVFVTDNIELVRGPCDILMLYTNDWVWEFDKEPTSRIFEGLQARRKVMAVNYRLGNIGRIPWTMDWDQYLFLNSSMEEEFSLAYMKAKDKNVAYSLYAKAMAPATDMSQFYEAMPNYDSPMVIVRHSSQGNAKYHKEFNGMIKSILDAIPEAIIRLMPAPSFLQDFGDRVISHKRNVPSVKEFLALGNVFWYSLPEGYTDQGPKVIMEAQASGLAVVGDDHSGPKARIVEGTGYRCGSFKEHMEALVELAMPSQRKYMGEAAREHAKANYGIKPWIEEIKGHDPSRQGKRSSANP